MQCLLVLICTMERCLKKTIVERNIVGNVKLKRRIAEIQEEEKNKSNKLFKEYFANYRSPSDMYKK